MLYFAYGANIDPAVLEERGVTAHSRVAARLPEAKLLFDKVTSVDPRIGRANVRNHPGETVHGVLYEISDEDIAKLDRQEGTPKHYLRVIRPIETGYGEEKTTHVAWMYIANPEMTAEGLMPDPEYLARLVDGGRDILPDDYRQELSQRITVNGETVGRIRKEAS